MCKRTGFRALSLAVAFLVPATCLAQAFLPPEGELYVTTTYHTMRADRHLLSDPVVLGVDFGSTSVDFGTTRSHVLVVDADLGLTDRIALSGGVAVVQARFTAGRHAETLGPENPALDDGLYRGGVSDVWFGMRYVVQRGEWLLTPTIQFLVPARDYPTLGHSVIGRGLNRFDAGLNAGRLIYFSDVPRAYIQGSYTYGLMENVGDTAIDQSTVNWEAGYFLTSSLTAQAFGAIQRTHGGLDWARDLHAHDEHFGEAFAGHDQASAEDFVQLGGTLSWAVRDSVDMFVSYSDTLWGVNTHNARAFSIGTTWFFNVFGEPEAELRLSRRQASPRLARSQMRALASEPRRAHP